MALNASPSQNFVPIREVRDGVLVLKDGRLRSIIMVSSVNLALKSEDEQNALIMQFQNFLNSLEFPVQISVQSRRLDIRPYIASLEERAQAQTEELLRVQTKEYIQFILWFQSSFNIMTKSFFIVVPYDPPIISTNKKSNNPLSGLLGGNKNKNTPNLNKFEEHRAQLEQRTAIVESGASRLGVRGVKLGSQELTELYYQIFNPGETSQAVDLGKQA